MIYDSETPLDTEAQRKADKRRMVLAFNISLASVLLLGVCFFLQGVFDLRVLAVQPLSAQGLLGIIGAPLLHGSFTHLMMNCIAILMLGTLAGITYPRATPRALPVIWLTSGLGAWLMGEPGTFHLGASGVTHGLMFFIFTLGLLRRDRAAIAAGMLAFAFYGGMVLTILPREAGVSWESHLGGAIGGLIAAFLFRRTDPLPPRQRYSWEIEEEIEQRRRAIDHDSYEPSSPQDVPVLWTYRELSQQPSTDEGNKVIRFPSSRPPEN